MEVHSLDEVKLSGASISDSCHTYFLSAASLGR